LDGSGEDPPRFSVDPFDDLNDLFLVARGVAIELQHVLYGMLCDEALNAIIWKEERLSIVEFARRERMKDLIRQGLRCLFLLRSVIPIVIVHS
jgi:hypothetical protein